MMTSKEAGRAEIIRQIQHFTKLGKDKPEDHEYNLTARGLQRFLADEPTSKKILIWTCEAYSAAEALIDREYGNSVSDAAENCPCLKDGCPAQRLEISFTSKVVEHIDNEEVEKRIKRGT